MLLFLSRKEVVKLQSRLYDFVLIFQVSRRACYSFWGRPNLVICRWNFANTCKNFGARAKRHLLAASHRHLVGTDFLRRCLGMSPELAADCSSIVFFKDGGWRPQVRSCSPVQFSCTKKLLMKLEVNQCYNAFQEDLVVWFPNQFLSW